MDSRSAVYRSPNWMASEAAVASAVESKTVKLGMSIHRCRFAALVERKYGDRVAQSRHIDSSILMRGSLRRRIGAIR
jgi:hypothetical protein